MKTKYQQKRKTYAVCEEQAHYGVSTRFRFLEFFAGGGMARAGLSRKWDSVWANDFCESKAGVYAKNWGASNLEVKDIARVKAAGLPAAEMAWGSFPCQDLSLAGEQSGIGSIHDADRTRSGTFWPFWRLIKETRPPIVVLENVVGALTSNNGADLRAITEAMLDANYRFGALVMDAQRWTPQSRPRLFIIGVRANISLPKGLYRSIPDSNWHTDAVINAYRNLPSHTQDAWIWWTMPAPIYKVPTAETLINVSPDKWIDWDSREKTSYLISLMNATHRQRLAHAQSMGRRIIGFGYRRTRAGMQRLEVRFDGIAGCLRTAGGGSSKQIVIEANGASVRTRLLSPREAARLQGLPDNYWLPDSYNDAYDLVGDGLCVPVVSHLGDTLLTPLAEHIQCQPTQNHHAYEEPLAAATFELCETAPIQTPRRPVRRPDNH
ncbi:MAG: DNA cytosine methyltransferase [Opitutaceae bacterium]|jgi:DNA (cytosine-5)-methyltransferase 1|nr:DNA cytosine methyltransferase [Opitutaceae bacterium]